MGFALLGLQSIFVKPSCKNDMCVFKLVLANLSVCLLKLGLVIVFHFMQYLVLGLFPCYL